MLELLFLLLPVAAGYGWIMGKNSNKHKQLKQKASLAKQYSAGLNFLLSDQEEKAVEHLIEFLEVNADTLETHLTLANLFRKRGEFDKALEIHDHLNQLDLDLDCANKIKTELAKDYISAGMLDRAETTLLTVILDNENRETILQMLVGIYQTMKDWQKADDLCTKPNSQKPLNNRLQSTLSHHCCELAEESVDSGECSKWLKKALKYDQSCARALLMLAEMAFKRQHYSEAIKHYQTIIAEDCLYTPMVIDLMEQSYLQMDDKGGFYDYLQSQADTNTCVSFAVKYSVYIEQCQGEAKALAFILTTLRKKPTIRSFVTLLELHAKTADSERTAAQFKEIKRLVKKYLDSKPLYECRNCGFETKQHYWLCPSCQTWGNTKPAIGLDGQ
ncbi:MAG: lipopolysaccharide biosynthesis regulator YciM [Phenylobacterium sp.]|jgi:lipopolysaccharide biosynthesis regulator YciM